MALTVGVLNEKGGVGKTATCINLAGCLVERGFRCLVIDFDPQGSAGEHLGVVSSGEDLLAAVLGERSLTEQVLETESGIDLIPTGPALQGLVEANRRARERLLQKAFEELPKAEWDFILIDAPARNDTLSDNVLVASDSVLIPVECKNQSLTPLLRLLDTIGQVQKDFEFPRDVVGIVPTLYKSGTRMSEDFVRALRARLSDLVFTSLIRDNTQIGEAPRKHMPVIRYAPGSIGAADFRRLTDEFLSRAGTEVIEHKEVANG